MSSRPSAEEFSAVLAKFLVRHREEAGMSKLALAQKSGLDQRTITFIERGTNSPSIKTLYLLCEALGVDMARLISDAYNEFSTH